MRRYKFRHLSRIEQDFVRLSEKHDSENPAAWFGQAADRLHALNALSAAEEGVSPSAISALHRAVELYLN
jgi:hypothetical protein